MLGKLLLLALCALAVWYLTRLSKTGKKKPPVTHKKLVQCPRCGVYHEAGGGCDCPQDARDDK